jgi:hypothetical protein
MAGDLTSSCFIQYFGPAPLTKEIMAGMLIVEHERAMHELTILYTYKQNALQCDQIIFELKLKY